MWCRSLAIGRTDLSEAERLRLLQKDVAGAPEKDKDIFDDTDLMRLTVRANDQAFKQGYDGVVDDGKRSARPWGFRVEDVRRDLKAQLWYGRQDVYVPLVHGMQIAARLGSSAKLRVEEESHAGIGVHWKREILEGLRDAMAD
jgi:pimeloyl-ACP methyl ester carboxylesterase